MKNQTGARIDFRVALITALLCLLGFSNYAGDLGEYRDWDESAQALFMTEDERREWKLVTSDHEAEQFIAGYMSRRGNGFEKELATRIEMADRYLTLGNTPGSETLRGKIVILFGPPTKIEKSGGAKEGKPATPHPLRPAPKDPALNDVYTNVGPIGSGAPTHWVESVSWIFTYSGEQVRERFQRDELVFLVEINPSTGGERFSNKRADERFDDLARQIAQASVLPDDEGIIRLADFQ